jgi:hypothetical protein
VRIPRKLALVLALAQGGIPFREAGADGRLPGGGDDEDEGSMDGARLSGDQGEASEGAQDQVDVGELERLMDPLVTEVLAASDPSDLDWRMSDLIAGGPLEDFLHGALTAAARLPSSELEVTADALDDDLHEAAPFLALSARLGLDLMAKLAHAREEGSAEGDAEAPIVATFTDDLDLQELLYGDRVPGAVQRALYAGQDSYISLLVLVSGRTLPDWLRADLRRRLLDGQREHLRVLVAIARAAELPVPEANILAELEPFDLDAAETESAAQRRGIRSHLVASRSARSRG